MKLNFYNLLKLPHVIPLLIVGLSSGQTKAQLVEPEPWQPPITNMVFSPLEWSAVPMTLDNLRIHDAADDIGFDLLRIDYTFGTSAASIAAAPFSISPGQPPSEEALIVASNNGIFLAENEAVFGYTALQSGNRVVPTASPNPRRVIVADLNGDGLNDIIEVPSNAVGALRVHLGANLVEEIGLDFPAAVVDVLHLGDNRLAVLGATTLWLVSFSGTPGSAVLTIEDSLPLAPVGGTASMYGKRLSLLTLGSGATALAVLGDSFLANEGAKLALFTVGGGVITAGGTMAVGQQTYDAADIATLNVGLPAQGLVVALYDGLTEGALEFLRVVTDAQGRPQPSALFNGNNTNIELDSFPSSLAVADFSPGQDGIDDIVVGALSADKLQPLLVIFEALAIASYETVGATVWVGDENNTSLPPNAVSQITVAQLNDDNIPDLAATLPDYEGGVVAIFRTRPPPCAVAVTTTVHGHLGMNSGFPFLDFPLDEPLAEREITKFNAAGKERVRGQDSIMNERRPQYQPPLVGRDFTRALCPIGHIAIDGRWENLTTLGAANHFIGRGGWLGAWIIPGLHSLPWGSPKVFWAAEMPKSIIQALLTGPIADLPKARLALVALGASTEFLGRVRSGRAGRIAAANLAVAIDESVSIARAAMDPCRGIIFYDMIAHSRGAPQISAASQMLAGSTLDALDHNTLASMIYLDSIDPIAQRSGLSDSQFGPYGDSIRPWAQAGPYVGDPWIVRLGNERLSNLHYQTAEGMAPLTDFVDAVLVTLHPDVDLMRDVVGSPVGHARAGTTFLNLVEPSEAFVSSSQNHNKGQLLMDGLSLVLNSDGTYGNHPENDPNQPENDRPEPADFNFQFLSGIGRLYPNADLIGHQVQNPGPRAIFAVDSVHYGLGAGAIDIRADGWVHSGSPGEALSPNERLPEACQSGTEPQEPQNPEPNAADLFRPLAPYWRELVSDSTFAISSGAVRGAQAAVASGQLASLYDADLPGMREEVEKIATGQFPADALWVQPGRKAKCDTKPSAGCVSVRSNDPNALSEISLHKLLGPFVAAGEDIRSSAGQGKAALRFEARMNQMQIDDAQNFQGLVNYYGEAMGGGHGASEHYLNIEEPAEVVQVLNLLSTAEGKMLLTIEYEIDSGGGIELSLLGKGLETKISVSGQTGRTTKSVFAVRTADGEAAIPDALKVSAVKARIYRLSVTPLRYAVRRLSLNKRYYQLIAMPEGSDPEEAAALAARMTYKGRQGQLASFTDVRALRKVLGKHDAAGYFWVSAKGRPSDDESFRWMPTGRQVVNQFAFNGVEKFNFYNAQTHHVFAYPNGTLGHALASSHHDGIPMGFIVDYGQ